MGDEMDGGRRQRSGGSRSLLIKGERLPAEVVVGRWRFGGVAGVGMPRTERASERRGERQADEMGGGAVGEGQERQFNEAQSLCHL